MQKKSSYVLKGKKRFNKTFVVPSKIQLYSVYYFKFKMLNYVIADKDLFHQTHGYSFMFKEIVLLYLQHMGMLNEFLTQLNTFVV